MLLTLSSASFAGDKDVTRILVRFEPKLSKQGVGALAGANDATIVDEIPAIRVHVLEVPTKVASKVIEALEHNPHVEAVELDSIAGGAAITNDPLATSGSQWHLSRISAPTAWDTTSGSGDVIVAVLDSGVQLDHPEFAGKLLPGYDFINADNDPSDDHGHGTAVAGTLAAAGNNSKGGAGVAFGCRILPVKVLDASNYGSYSAIAKGITYAADQGARIINTSICGQTSSFTLQSAVDYAWNKNAVVFAAAGNDATEEPRYPAACRNAVGVSALDQANSKASFSSYGSNVVLSAPGKDILTTQRGSTYGTYWGTSFACPVTAGVGALALSVNPQLSNADLIQLLKNNADDLGPVGYDTSFGYGRVNAARSVAAAAAVTGDTTAPDARITSPSAGSTLQGIVTVTTSTSDVDDPVSRVELYIDGVLAETVPSSSASFQWDTTVTENGNYTLRIQAYDSAGNMGASDDYVVTVSNSKSPDTFAPTTRIVSPKSGTQIYGGIKVRVAATDDVGVTKVELYVNRRLVATDTTSSPVFTWRPRAAGTYYLRAIAYDAAGNAGTSRAVKVVR